MPRALHRLTALDVSRLKAPGVYADGGGLLLQIKGPNARSWVFRYTRHGKTRDLGLGAAHKEAVPLLMARQLASDARKLLAQNIDPIEHRRSEREKARLENARAMTFKTAAERYIEAHGSSWRNEKHRAQWRATLDTYAMPTLGKTAVQAIATGDVMKVLESIWHKRPETAARLRGRIEAVLDWATAHGHRRGDNPAKWRGHLAKLLPPKSRVKPVRHFKALPYAEVPALMVKLREQDGVAALALEWTILTAARTGETIGATPDEIDTASRTRTIEAERMKARRVHRVPLSDRALAIYKRAREIDQGPYLFPGRKAKTGLSNMAMLKTLNRIGYGHVTVHGMRSAFRDWVSERTVFPRELAEAALAHVVSDQTEAAYARSDLLDRRRKLMADWAKFCATPPAKTQDRDKVVPIRKRR